MMIKFSSPFRAFATSIRIVYARWLGYRILATEQETIDRLNKCESCEELTGERQCKICSCFVDAKTMLTTEQCPKRYWLRIWDKNRTV